MHEVFSLHNGGIVRGVIGRLPKDVDVIFHLAGQASGENSFSNPIGDLEQNTASTLNLIRYGIDIDAKRFVFASSMSCYGDIGVECATEDHVCRPKTCYAVAKLAAEGYLRVFADQLPSVIFRIFNVYGAGQNLANMRQGMVSIYLAQALQGGKVHVKGSLDRFRDFIEVGDVVKAFVRAGETNRADGQVLNLGTGVRTTVGEVLETLKRSIPTLEWYVEGVTPGDQKGLYADTERLSRVLGFTPKTGTDEGFANFVDWARGQIPMPSGQ